MAKRDVYNFQIKGDNQQAKQSFEELKDLADQLNKASSNVKIDPDNNGNLTEFIRTMTETLDTYTKLTKALDEEHTIKFRMGGQRELAKEIEETKKMVEKGTREMLRDMEKTYSSYYNQTGKRIRVPPSYNQNLDQQSDTKQKAINAREQASEIRNRTNSTLGIGRRALSSGYINHQQASEYRQNIQELMGERAQGASMETVLSGEKYTPARGSIRANALEGLEEARAGIADRQARIQQIQSDPNLKDDKIRNSLLSKNNEEIEDLTSTITNLQGVIKELDDAVSKIQPQSEAFTGANVREKDDRSTLRGRMFERASATGLAVTGAMAYSMGSTYQRGVQATTNQRPQSLNLGYQTSDYDFRGIRQNLMESGAPMGWKGTDMLDFAEKVIGGGINDKSELYQTTDELARFSKFSGAGQEQSSEYMSGLYRSGAVSTSDQAKAIQDAFVGAIKMSGMEGREQEQIEALTAINDNLFKGREVNNEEAQNRVAMTTLLANTGNRGLQGSNLADFMTTADDAIKGASPFSNIGMMLGVGTDPRYNGQEGYYNYITDTQGGFNSENANKLITGAMDINGGNAKASAGYLHQQFGGAVNIEALEEVISKYPSGIPQSEIDSIVEKVNQKGDEEIDNRQAGYDESPDSAREVAEAYAEKLATLLNENAVIDQLTEIKEAINDWGSNNAVNATATTLGGGLLSGVMTGITSTIAMSIGTILPNILSSKFAPMMANMAGSGGIKGTIGGWFSGASKGGATSATTAVTGSGLGSTVMNSADDVAGVAMKGATTGSKVLGMGSKLLSGASKALPWIAGAMSISNIAKADDKVKATGEEVGSWGGALAGMQGGALLGSFFPGLGTLIGGGIGGILGGIGGSKVGGWAVDKAKDGWNWLTGKDNKVSASELEAGDEYMGADGYSNYMSQENTATANEDKATTNQKLSAEQLRANNIYKETENMSMFEAILSRVEDILEQARAQNGIIGSTTGLTGSGSSPTGMDFTGNGEYWSNTNIKEHDLGTTSNAITAEELDKWINSKAPDGSIMRGMGETFMKAGTESGLDPRYLVAHAAHETGWGTSNIAKKKGNMYGIGAFDASPYSSAYGYDNTQAGIIEGAKWISENYYAKGQTTLDSMRNNGGKHEYATDPAWDEKIANIMKGSEKYTSPSVKISTNVTLNSTGTNEGDAQAIANMTSSNISKAYTQELTRLR